MPYQDPDVVSDETTLAEQFLDSLADQVPGWEPHDGQIEPPIAESAALIVAPANTMLKDALRADYEGWGTTVLNFAPIAATAATSTVAILFSGPGTLPAGAQFVAGDDVVFVTLEDATAAAAGQTVAAIDVAAAEPGAEGNGVSGNGELQDAYEFVQQITFEAPTANGVDAEDRDAYLDRLADRAQRFRDVPVTVSDFAAAALDIAGVARCLATNLYDPANPGVVSDGHITLTAIDAAGADASPAVAAQIVTYLEGDEQRPLNVVVHTVGATRTAVTVTFQATVLPGYDGPTTITAAADAILAYLDPAVFGYDETVRGKWRQITKVYPFEVAQVVQQTTGIDIVIECLVNGADTPLDLPGLAPLPDVSAPGAVTGTLVT